MKHDKAPFDPAGPYVARKPFSFQGEPIRQGDAFSWKKLGCGARKLRQLWDNGFIVPAGSLTQAPAETAPPAPSTQAPAPLGKPSAETNPDDKAKSKAEKRAEAGRKAAATRAARAQASSLSSVQEAQEPNEG